MAILVVKDGEEWLPTALRSLQAQDYPFLRVVAVDNGSKDSSRAVLAEHLPSDDLVVVNQSTGFGRAVHAASRHPAVAAADQLLLVHDDLALEPSAVTLLVEALAADGSLAAVGPKLREWGAEPVLQEVGMTADRFGRAETNVERGELDQGQLDARREVLYVTTAAMLLRAEAFAEVGGFDTRFTGLRDDLDLCWRAWLLGWRVEVVPQAVGYHVAAGSRGARRLWSNRRWQARFLSERHALASVLKNYSLRRLLWVLPLTTLLGVVKLVGFALTRRFADAGATMRAYGWNLVNLPGTLRRRRAVQRSRRRTDAELGHLFATGLPRVRAYADALRGWLAGPDAPAILTEQSEHPASPGASRVARFVRQRPAVIVGAVLGLAYLVGAASLLGAGQILGGAVLPWPDDPAAFLHNYANPVAGDPLATQTTATPVQALLGGLGLLVFGNAWLAQRLAVLGLLPLAWLAALRAGRLVTSRRGPRVVGATLYVLSPVVLGTLAQGRFGELIVAALLPAIVLLTARVSNSRAASGPAWRATAWLALSSALAVAAAPGLGVVVGGVLLAGLAVALMPAAQTGQSSGLSLLRVSMAAGGALSLLAPWLSDLSRAPASTLGLVQDSALPAWRALALAPVTHAGYLDVGGYLAAAVTGAVVLLALLLGLRLRPLAVTALLSVLVLSASLAWGADRIDSAWVWPPALLLPGAAALAGLGVLAARTLGPALRSYKFGVPQLVALLAVVPVAVGLGWAVWSVAGDPWEQLDRDVELAPPYVTAEADRVGPYRLLLLDADADGVRWGVTEAAGPSMLEFGTSTSAVLTRTLNNAVTDVLAGDLEGGQQLGLANVRYVIIAGEDQGLRDVLTDQPDLEPMVAGEGRVFLVRPWLPRAAVLPADVAERILDGGEASDLPAYEEAGLARTQPGRYEGTAEGTADGAGDVLVASEEPGLWEASVAGAGLERLPAADGVPLDGFTTDAELEGEVSLRPAGQSQRTTALVFQAVVFLALFSLILHPPRSTRRQRPRGAATVRPADPRVEPASDADETPLEERLAEPEPQR